jgi:hypothetical protein
MLPGSGGAGRCLFQQTALLSCVGIGGRMGRLGRPARARPPRQGASRAAAGLRTRSGANVGPGAGAVAARPASPARPAARAPTEWPRAGARAASGRAGAPAGHVGVGARAQSPPCLAAVASASAASRRLPALRPSLKVASSIWPW